MDTLLIKASYFAESLQKAAAILATSTDSLQDPQELRKQLDKKMVSFLRVLHLRNGAYYLHASLGTAIKLKCPAAVVGLLCTRSALTTLTPKQIEALYNLIPTAIESQDIRRAVFMNLTTCLNERGKFQALNLAAGKLNDDSLTLWVLKKLPTWTWSQLRDWGVAPAARCGSMEPLRALLGRYVLHLKLRLSQAKAQTISYAAWLCQPSFA